MVQITHALVKDEETGKLVRISAENFDKGTDGKKACHCPDENCGASDLTHYKAYMQTFYDLETGEPYKLKVPAHFKRKQGSPQHDISCTAVDAYNSYQSYAREIGGLSSGGAFVYNLNIMTDARPAPVRPRKVISSAFGDAVSVRENKSDAPNGGSHERRVLSEGLNHVEKLAGLLDRTEFDRAYREAILLRDGRKRYTLAEIFEDDTLKLFRDRVASAKNGDAASPVLLQFKPIMLAKFHSKDALTIQGEAKPIVGTDGQQYYASVKLHCRSKEIYEAIRKEMRDGNRSFLVYAENARVDTYELSQKKKEIESGKAKDRAVFVHVHVNAPQQVAAWTPYNGQLDMEVAGMDLPIHHKPAREIPAHLIK